jgi:hypothetical protein
MPSAENGLTGAGEVRYTASDAAEFSRLGACMTAMPTDEIYRLPKIEDTPRPVEKRPATGPGAKKSSDSYANPTR